MELYRPYSNDLLSIKEYDRCIRELSRLTDISEKNVADEVNDAWGTYVDDIPHTWPKWKHRVAESKDWQTRGDFEKNQNRRINAVWCYAVSIWIITPHLTGLEVVYQVYLCFEPKFSTTHLERLWINARGQYDSNNFPISAFEQLVGRRNAQITNSCRILYGL